MTRSGILLLPLLLIAGPPQSGDPSAVEQTIEKQIKTQPSAGNWQRLGLARFVQNRFADAIPAFQQAVQSDPALWTSHLFLGISFYRTNKFPDALKSLGLADQYAPARARGTEEVAFWRASTLIALGRPWEGLHVLEQLLTWKPDYKEALALLARTYGDVSGSLWNDVAERFTDTPAGLEVQGNAFESEGNATDALNAYRESHEEDPHRIGSGLAMGRLLLAQGKLAEALPILESKHKQWPYDPQVCLITGVGLIQAGRLTEAVPLLETATAWSRTEAEAPMALAQVQLSLKHPEEAAAAARKAVKADPSSPAAHDLLIAAFTQSGNAAEVARETQRWSEVTNGAPK